MLPPTEVNSFDPTMRGMANQNFYTDVIAIFGTIGLLFPNHPEADQWVADFITDFERQLTVHVYPSGVWEESHTYWQHVLFTVLPVIKMLKERGRHDFSPTRVCKKRSARFTNKSASPTRGSMVNAR
jgi:hypothetical protein